MASRHWLGYTVSLDCGPGLGVYQGIVCDVDNQTLQLQRVFKNGLPCGSSSITFGVSDIKELHIISEPSGTKGTQNAQEQEESEELDETEGTEELEELELEHVIELRKPIPKRPGRTVPDGAHNFHSQPAPPRTLAISHNYHHDGYGSGDGNRTPNRRERLRQRWHQRDEACFGSPVDKYFDQDFDFEKNLALFDKKAVYDEIAIQRPDLVRQADGQRKQKNYRHDENILASSRALYPAIIVPNPGDREYVTDDGLVIPSMRPELLCQLHQKAKDYGFSLERQAELMGRAATEMSLQLLGGAHRLNPNNAHQWPTVVVMCGPHLQGTVGLICARQLETHGVTTVVYLSDPSLTPLMAHELELYQLGGNNVIRNTQNLPVAADLIVMALAGLSHTSVNTLAAQWANQRRAPVLALDPPPSGTPGVDTKFSLVPTLPMSHSLRNGKLYLCNLGIPRTVFTEMGIKYRSPFGAKFVIPLHPNED